MFSSRRKESGTKSDKKVSGKEQTKQPEKPKSSNKGGNNSQKAASKPSVKSAGSSAKENTGLKGPVKQDPFVNFGPVLREFLNSKTLVDQTISVSYKKGADSPMTISVGFREVLANGVSIGKPTNLSIEDYMSSKQKLLKKENKNVEYIKFLSRLNERLDIDLSGVTPRTDHKMVIRFIKEHLSPAEIAILQLSDDKWDSIDTGKLVPFLKESRSLIVSHYVDRVTYLVETIGFTGSESSPTPEMVAPIKWASLGFGPVSESTAAAQLKHDEPDKDRESEFAKKVSETLAKGFNADPDEGII